MTFFDISTFSALSYSNLSKVRNLFLLTHFKIYSLIDYILFLEKPAPTMTSDPGIICFQHCGPKIFCLDLPECCPACNDDLFESKFKLMPFRLPYPFVRASQHPCSVVIRPTTGDFLQWVKFNRNYLFIHILNVKNILFL